MSFFSAATISGSQALRKNTPWPATITGRSARLIMSTAWASSFGAGCGRDSVRYLSLP